MTDLGRLIEPHLTEIMAHAGEAKRTATRFLKLEGASLALGIMCTERRCSSSAFWASSE